MYHMMIYKLVYICIYYITYYSCFKIQAHCYYSYVLFDCGHLWTWSYLLSQFILDGEVKFKEEADGQCASVCNHATRCRGRKGHLFSQERAGILHHLLIPLPLTINTATHFNFSCSCQVAGLQISGHLFNPSWANY